MKNTDSEVLVSYPNAVSEAPHCTQLEFSVINRPHYVYIAQAGNNIISLTFSLECRKLYSGIVTLKSG